MAEPQIQYAIDPVTRNIVDAQAAYLPKKPYECIKCGSRLVIRQGPYQIWHFSHYGEPEAKDCPLYYGGRYEDLLTELRTSEIEIAEKDKEIRLAVVPAPFGRSVRLYGVLPAIEPADIPAGTDVPSLLSSMRVQGVGLRRPPAANAFHPGNPEALIELDANAKRYEIKIETEPIYESLTGTWTCGGIREGEMFAGEADRADRVGKVAGLGRGETAFVFTREEPESLPNDTSLYRTGAWYVISFSVEESKADLLRQLSGEDWQDPVTFFADVVLPWYANPRSRFPVIGEAGTSASVAIIPPEGMDPEFEIISIPLARGYFVSVPKAGDGLPRWFSTSFPEEGSRRLSIHWADRHRGIHLNVGNPVVLQMGLPEHLAEEGSVGLFRRTNGDTEIVSGLVNRALDLDSNGIAGTLDEFGLEPSAPPGYKFGVVARFAPGGSVDATVYRSELAFDELELELPAWIREGLERISLDFDSLGAIELRFERPKRWQIDISDDELRKRLRAAETLPKKARWHVVRDLLNAPAGTPHSELPSGIKKRVRQALLSVRNERRD